jgi:pre-mRNA-splicing helicase BRR2
MDAKKSTKFVFFLSLKGLL